MSYALRFSASCAKKLLRPRKKWSWGRSLAVATENNLNMVNSKGTSKWPAAATKKKKTNSARKGRGTKTCAVALTKLAGHECANPWSTYHKNPKCGHLPFGWIGSSQSVNPPIWRPFFTIVYHRLQPLWDNPITKFSGQTLAVIHPHPKGITKIPTVPTFCAYIYDQVQKVK